MVLDSFSKSLDPYLVAFGLPHLSSHLPLILQSLAFWLSLQLLSRLASPKIFPKTYPNLKPSTKTSWDVHFVAFCHATIIVPLVIRVWWNVRRQGGMDGTHPLAKDRTYGYDKQAADVYSIALGYFIWDAAVSILYDGLGFIAHGVLCMTAFTLTFHPVFQYDGLGFLLWELSTPFLNIHWFLDKLNMTGSTAQLVNAAFLLSTYVGARLTFGVYNSYSWFMHTNFVQHTPPIPISIKLFFMIGNVTLNCLNFFWFRAMVRAVQKRFVAKPESKDGKGKGKANGNEDVDPMKILDGRQRLRVGVKGRNDEALEREVGAARAVRAKDE